MGIFELRRGEKKNFSFMESIMNPFIGETERKYFCRVMNEDCFFILFTKIKYTYLYVYGKYGKRDILFDFYFVFTFTLHVIYSIRIRFSISRTKISHIQQFINDFTRTISFSLVWSVNCELYSVFFSSSPSFFFWYKSYSILCIYLYYKMVTILCRF